MDEMDRTCSIPFEIPDEALPLLRRAADLGLERACDFGDWDDDVRAQVLHAARTVDLLNLGAPSAFQVVELANNALRWGESPAVRLTTLEALSVHFAALGEACELLKVRDRALRHMGLPLDTDRER